MAPDSLSGVMSARAGRAVAGVCMPFGVFVVSIIDVWALVGLAVLMLR